MEAGRLIGSYCDVPGERGQQLSPGWQQLEWCGEKMLDSRYVWRGSRQDLPAGGSIQITPKNSHSGRSSPTAQGPRSSFKGLLNLCSHSCLSLGWQRFTLLSPNRQGGHTQGKQSDRRSYGDGNPRVPSPECSKGLQRWQALSANKTDKGNFCRCI